MARKFLDLEEAAKMVGVTPDTLNEMRERREIFGVRDGASWKFKQEDVERLMADRQTADEEGDFAELDEDPDSILLSEVELGQSSEASSSTIIGGKKSRGNPADSDIKLAEPMGEDEFELAPEKHDSDINLDAALTDEPQSKSDVLAAGSGVSPMFDDLDTLDLDMPSAADSGIVSGAAKKGPAKSAGMSDLELAGDSGLTVGKDDAQDDGGSALSLVDEDVLALGEASGLGDSNGGSSAIELTEDLDDDLVLGGSSHGDLSKTGDSGISLLDPADSGLSLESAPLELGGSAVESLELGEEELLVDEPAPKKKKAAAPVAAEEESDDDFLLTPLEEAATEESSDSGSQVIALEGEVEFGDAEAGSLEAAGAGGVDLDGDLGDDLGASLGGAALTPAAATAGAAAVAAGAGAAAAPAREAPYSGWNVASLVMCAILLMFTGMFMFDLLRNMWSWNGPYKVNSAMMDLVMSMFDK